MSKSLRWIFIIVLIIIIGYGIVAFLMLEFSGKTGGKAAESTYDFTKTGTLSLRQSSTGSYWGIITDDQPDKAPIGAAMACGSDFPKPYTCYREAGLKEGDRVVIKGWTVSSTAILVGSIEKAK